MRKLFEIQENESKHRLKHRFFQTPIADPKLLFGVREYIFNYFLPLSVVRATQTYMPEIFYFIHRFLPEMTMNDFSVIATLQKSEGRDDSPQQTIQEEQKSTILLAR